jgi:hypothetical protein
MTRFIHVLTHPILLLAAGLVALNDFWLKVQYPSWLTGKLSDAGMLVILPLLLAGLLGLFLSRRWAGALALGGIAAGFVLLKSGAGSAAWLTDGLAGLTGFHLRSLADPSDLLLLPLLFVPAWVWLRTPGEPLRPAVGWRLLLVPLVGWVLLADAAMPDPGVSCLYLADGELRAQGGYYAVFASQDGGLTWQAAGEGATVGNECGVPADAPQQVLFSLPDGGAQYRVTLHSSLERSLDGGLSWQAVALGGRVSEAEETYVRKTRSGNLTFETAPLDALLDPVSGNLLLAMGQEGVLVVRPDGSSQAVAVGKYVPESLQAAGLTGYLTLLGGELCLAGLVGLTWLGTAALRERGRAWRMVIILSWLALLGNGVALFPDIAASAYTGVVSILGLLLSAGFTLALLVGAAVTRRAGALRWLPAALLVAALVGLPYGLWGWGFLGFYWLAALLAAGVALAAVGLYCVRPGRR